MNSHQINSIPLNPVTSSQIAALGYDDKTKTLAVRFNGQNHKVYHFHDVPKTVFDGFSKDSIGKHFNASVRNKYKHTIIEHKPNPYKG